MHDAPSPYLVERTEACSIRQVDEGLCLNVKRMHGLSGKQRSRAGDEEALGSRARAGEQSGSAVYEACDLIRQGINRTCVLHCSPRLFLAGRRPFSHR